MTTDKTEPTTRAQLDASIARLRAYVDAGSTVHTASSYRTPDGHVHLIEFDDLQAVLDAAGAAQPASDDVMTGEIRAVQFEDGEPMQCSLEDCECPEHEGLTRRAGTYLTIRLDDDAFNGAGSWRVEVRRVAEDTAKRLQR
ncbi:hypothetical protein QWJ90_00020 [Microbacterium oryzae]|uniref:hypothetical protein n=1 Tax=Microbacterium oryzae TaxID=743009 RepID=UPI0025AFC4E1|nr:hypothetical protein [Microbacterium oryzae]MDN3309313.1 hypothetical protein [Microbacterium oryzae]